MFFKKNMEKFKKVHEDKNHAILRHDDGHEIKIAKAPLSRAMLRDLSKLKMAEGGEVKKLEVEELKEPKPKNPVEYEEVKQNDPLDYEPITKMADGGEVSGKKRTLGEAIGYPGAKKMAEGGEAEAPAQQAASPQAPVVINLGQPSPGMAPANMVNEQQPQLQPPTQEAPQPAAASPMPQQAPAQDISPLPQNPSVLGGAEQQASGIQNEAQAIGQQADQAKKQLVAQSTAIADLSQQWQETHKQLNEERAALQEDIKNSHIDPNRYLGSKDFGGRLSTMVGLVLGGFGGQGHGNAALDFLNKEIDRDIEAQKAEIDKRNTLLGANMKQFSNERDALDMTRVMMADQFAAKLKAAELSSQNPLAKARAQQQLGQLEQQIAPLVSQIATRKMLQEQTSDGKTSSIDPAKLIPSVVPEKEQGAAYKELKEAQDLSKAKENVFTAFDQISKLQTVGNRALNPIQSSSQIKALRDPLVAALSKATAGRFTEQDAKFLDTLFPSVTDNAETLAAKKSAIDRLLSEKMNFPTLSAYGIDVSKFDSTSGEGRFSPKEKQMLSLARANPDHPNAKLIFKKLGVNK